MHHWPLRLYGDRLSVSQYFVMWIISLANKTSGEEHDSLTKSDAECTNTGGSHIKAWVSIQNMFFRHDKKLFFHISLIAIDVARG